MLKVTEEVNWGDLPTLYLVCSQDTLYKFKDKSDAVEFAKHNGSKTPENLTDSYFLPPWRERYERTVCCNKAFPKFCVCTISWACDVHGERCIGSHD